MHCYGAAMETVPQDEAADAEPPREPWFFRTVARALAVCFGAFTVLNALGTLRDPGFDANLWWIDLRPLPSWLSAALLLVAGALLAWWGIRLPPKGWRSHVVVGAMAILVLAASGNTVGFYVARGPTMSPGTPVPLSLLVFGSCAFLAVMIARRRSTPLRGWSRWAVVVGVCGVFVVALPLAQIAFFGTTDYRRPADAIVVLGAKVQPGGWPSLSLRDRLETGIELYDQGLAPVLIMSGGTGESGHNEGEVMRGTALDAGVPDDAIIVDPNGVDTQSTVDNTESIAQEHGFTRILVVSHPYHLPRIKLAFEDTDLEVATVPSDTTSIPQLPGIVAREIPAFWVYYLRALAG